MNEQWKCPQCETLCNGKFCPVCGCSKASVEQNLENQKMSVQYEQSSHQTPPPKSPVPPVQSQPQPKPPVSPVQPKPPVPPASPKSSKPKKGKKLGLIIAACAVGVVVLALVLICVIPANQYQSYAGLFIERCSSDESNIEKFLEKGNQALEDGDYDRAEFFYKDKVLVLNRNNQDAMVGLLRKSMAQSDTSAIESDLNQLSGLSESITNINKTYIVEAVDTLETPAYDQLKDNLTAQQATIDDILAVMSGYENYLALFGFDELQADMINKYIECYDTASADGYDMTFTEQILNNALAKFPDNTDLLTRQQEILTKKADEAKSQIDVALANGDIEQAKQWYDQLNAVSTEDHSDYANKISQYETMVNFMNQANDLLSQSNYDGLCALIDSDTTYNGNSYYMIDGKYVESVESGYGLIYDVNGIYVGDIVNNERSGNGKQFYYYIGLDTYSVADGAWQNNQLNGQASLLWLFAEDKSQAITSGNFTDGYENGTMTVTWHDMYDWSATYKAEMGNYVDAKKNSDGYRYAYDSNNERQAWIYSNRKEDHGFWIN